MGYGTVEEIAIYIVTLLMPRPTLAHIFQSVYIVIFLCLKIWYGNYGECTRHVQAESHRIRIARHHAVSWSATSGQNAPRKIHGKDRSRFLGPWRQDSQANHKESGFRASLASKDTNKARKIHPWSSEDQNGSNMCENILWSLNHSSDLFATSRRCEKISSCWTCSLALLSKSHWIYPYMCISCTRFWNKLPFFP